VEERKSRRESELLDLVQNHGQPLYFSRVAQGLDLTHREVE
jgi:hypothetical protein